MLCILSLHLSDWGLSILPVTANRNFEVTEKESCPLCLAQPCDWVTDPHKATDALFLATADLRIKSGVGEKPMLSDLPQVIGDRLSAAKQIIAALRDLSGAQASKTVHGKDVGQWRHKAQQWLLMEPE